MGLRVLSGPPPIITKVNKHAAISPQGHKGPKIEVITSQANKSPVHYKKDRYIYRKKWICFFLTFPLLQFAHYFEYDLKVNIFQNYIPDGVISS